MRSRDADFFDLRTLADFVLLSRDELELSLSLLSFVDACLCRRRGLVPACARGDATRFVFDGTESSLGRLLDACLSAA